MSRISTIKLFLSLLSILFTTSLQSQVINTIAGNGTSNFSGDGGTALNAELTNPRGMAFDSQGNMFFCDGNRIRKIDINGIITTIAGSSTSGFSGDGGPATAALFNTPYDIGIDAANNIYISDKLNIRIRRIDAVTGIITTVAGGGTQYGNNIPALQAALGDIYGIAVDAGGNIFISQYNLIVKVDAISGLIYAVAGGGFNQYGDGIPATGAQIHFIFDVTVTPAGELYFGTALPSRIRKVDNTGIITTVAGNNGFGFPPPYSEVALNSEVMDVHSITTDAVGNVFFSMGSAYTATHGVFRLSTDGYIYYHVGGANPGFSGDGGYCILASLHTVQGLAVNAAGELLIADGLNYRLRKVDSSCMYPSQPDTIAGDSYICPGAVHTYSVPPVAGATSYLWTIPNGWTGNNATNNVTLTTANNGGIITLKAVNSCGEGLPRTKQVISLLPNLSVSTNTPVLCDGESTTLYTSTNHPRQWTYNGVDIPGATGSSYTTTQAGNYAIYTTQSACPDTSNPATITVHPVPVAEIIGPDTLCLTDNLLLNTVTDTGLSYQWARLNYGLIAGATDTIFDPWAEGFYYYTVHNNFYCYNTSETVWVAYMPSLPITFSGGLLSVSSVYSSYQWYLNGTLIPGATSDTYEPLTDGDYYAVVTNIICSENSDTITVTGLSVENSSAISNNSTVYPNPFTNQATITFPNNTHLSHTFALYNTQGMLVRYITNITASEVLINREMLPPGFYYYRLSIENYAVAHGKLVIE